METLDESQLMKAQCMYFIVILALHNNYVNFIILMNAFQRIHPEYHGIKNYNS